MSSRNTRTQSTRKGFGLSGNSSQYIILESGGEEGMSKWFIVRGENLTNVVPPLHCVHMCTYHEQVLNRADIFLNRFRKISAQREMSRRKKPQPASPRNPASRRGAPTPTAASPAHKHRRSNGGGARRGRRGCRGRAWRRASRSRGLPRATSSCSRPSRRTEKASGNSSRATRT